MVSHHISKLSAVKAAQVRINLVVLEGLLEVDRDLCGNLSEYSGVHTCITGLLEEEVLGLGQAKIAVHG